MSIVKKSDSFDRFLEEQCNGDCSHESMFLNFNSKRNEKDFDVFVVEEKINNPAKEIPIE